MTLTTREVGKRLRAQVFPLLTAQGFAVSRGKTFWRHCTMMTDVVRFGHLSRYIADVAGIETLSVQVEFGAAPNVGMPENVRRHGDLPCPDPWHCLFRCAPQKGLVQPRLAQGDIWVIVPDGTNLDAVITDITRVIRDDAPAWFARVHDLPSMKRFLETSEEDGFRLWGFGRPGSLARQAALVALARALRASA